MNWAHFWRKLESFFSSTGWDYQINMWQSLQGQLGRMRRWCWFDDQGITKWDYDQNQFWWRSYLPVSSKSLPALISSIWSHLLQQRNIFSFLYKNIYINARNMFFSSKKSNFSARCSSQFATENQDWSLIHLDLHLILITILALRHFAINYKNRTRRKGRINRRQAKGPDQLSSMSGAFSHFGNPFRIKDPEILFQINLFIKGSFENYNYVYVYLIDSPLIWFVSGMYPNSFLVLGAVGVIRLACRQIANTTFPFLSHRLKSSSDITKTKPNQN